MRIGEYAPGGIESRALLHDRSIRHDAPPPARAATDSYQQEAEVLLQLGIGKPKIAHAMQVVRHNGTSIEQELLASGSIDTDSDYASLARGLRLPFPWQSTVPSSTTTRHSTASSCRFAASG